VVSAVSAWEIAIKHAAGQLQFPVQRYNDIMEDFGFDSLDVTPTHGLAAGALPRHHKDPFDRMLIAQCLLEGLVLVSHDPWMRAYDVPVLGS
jgi:PIN domain nuclease of toxin-antitoxin system